MIHDTKRNRQRLAIAVSILLLSACGNDGGSGGLNSTAAINDTGITGCSSEISENLPCPLAGYPGQDAQYGRDKTHDDDTDGHAGFSFTKLDGSGTALTDQTAVYAVTPWDCVEDNVTGLMWEVKTTDGGLRDSSWTYSWYNSTGTNDGGNAGTANGGACFDVVNCDTEKYVAAVNAAGLCGHSDWRLPSVAELLTLTDLGVGTPGPTIDSDYFPNTQSSYIVTGNYFSSTPFAGTSLHVWGIIFNSGVTEVDGKSVDYYVRLVRD